MSFTIRARTARKSHLCSDCHWVPSLRGVPTILPGHRYLIHVAFPDGEVNRSRRPCTTTQCVACAVEREQTNGLLVAGACGTFCCGTAPCALPHPHNGDHSCRRCAAEATKSDAVPRAAARRGRANHVSTVSRRVND